MKWYLQIVVTVVDSGIKALEFLGLLDEEKEISGSNHQQVFFFFFSLEFRRNFYAEILLKRRKNK